MNRFAEAWQRFRRPVRSDTREDLAAAWARLDPEFRVPHQTIGRMEEGCGATIGAMPACDFGCVGCYLGKNANATPPLPADDIKAQMRTLRGRLGRWGNLQLTDGEVTLRPENELLELLRYAREVELIPMVMTHGETFRRRPGLLERLMVEGELVELSIHIDATQRGRDADYAGARREGELMPLREEFAEMIRAARASTGRPLRVASTCTVTPENLDEVGTVVHWFIDHAEAFRIISFQPAAQVGRSRAGVGDVVTSDDVWARVAEAVTSHPGTRGGATPFLDRRWWFGHPECSQLCTGLVAARPGKPHRYQTLCPHGDPPERAMFDRLLTRFGGVSFRSGSSMVLAAQTLGMLRRDPLLFLREFPAFGAHVARRIAPDDPARFVRELVTRRSRLHPLTIATHQFMSREQLATPLGRERVRNCIFTVPIDGELVSMCEVNALGVRDAVYHRAAGEPTPPPLDLVDLTVEQAPCVA